MAQQALPPGAIRRRTAFGLLDADGWTWAGLKATFWFLLIMFMLAVVPNWAYYFTTSSTIEVGYNFASIVNLCPADNEKLPCPAPAGATLPWQTSPEQVAMPLARSGSSAYQSGSDIYIIGGTAADGPTADVFVTGITEEGNVTGWSEGAALPQPRSDAALGVYAGIPFVMGGLDASGAPTSTVYKGILEEGVLTGWELADGENNTDELTLPQPLSGAGVIAATGGFVLVGGRDVNGEPTDGVYVAWIDEASSSGRLLAWQPFDGLALPEARADVVATGMADFAYVIGGEGPDGPVDTVFRLELQGQEAATNEAGALLGWAVAPQDQALPEPRTDATSFTSGGAIRVIGGFDAAGVPQESVLWAVPDTSTGVFADGWQQLDETDLPVGTADATVGGVGAYAFVFGGETPEGISDGMLRAALSPRPPFFQLGIAGATIPGLAIEGQVGQELGYVAVMTVGLTNFVLLIIIGIAFSRPDSSKRVLSKLSRGRLKMPPDEQYRS